MSKPAVKSRDRNRASRRRASTHKPRTQLQAKATKSPSTLEANFAAYLQHHLDDPGAPFAKVSVTMPEWLRDDIAKKVGSRQFSSYVTYALIRESQQEALKEFLDEAMTQHGEPSEADMKWAHDQLA